MKRIITIMALVPMMFLLNSCEGTGDPVEKPDDGKDPGTDPGTEKVELPTPPETIKSANLFVVDMFSTLMDDGEFFEMRDVASVAQHISNQTGMRPLIYMFDRSDFTVGQSHPLNKLSYTSNVYQLFAQHEATTSTVTKGTGMVTQYPINVFDGIAQGGAYMSGLTISAPLTTATPVCIYTTRIASLDQMKQIFEARSQKLQGDSVIIALVEKSITSDVAQYVEQTMRLRIETYANDSAKLDLMVIVPASYVCRSIERGMTVNLPYCKISIEKWLW